MESIIQAQKKTILNRNDELDHLQTVINGHTTKISTQAEIILARNTRIEELKCTCSELIQMVRQKQTDIETLQKCNETRMKELEELKERLHEKEQKVDYVQEPDIERETRTTEYEPDYIMVDAVYPNETDIRFHIPINAYKDE